MPVASSIAAGVPAPGRRWQLAAGGYTAEIAGVGATLRALRFENRDLIVPFEAAQLRPAYRGAVLAPWPNRVIDGRYRWDGVDHQLPITEPRLGHALHGLALWLEFAPIAESGDAVTLCGVIQPQAGYPFRMALEIRYALGVDGLKADVTATNLGETPAPFGVGIHPYLVAPTGTLDDWTLSLPAVEVALTLTDRLLPGPIVSVEGSARFDFRHPRRIGAVALDHAFTGVRRGPDGRAEATVTDAEGRGVSLAWGAELPWVQVHTADLPPGEGRTRVGVAVEPMSCPPDAFGSGRDLWRVGAGETVRASWSLAAIG